MPTLSSHNVLQYKHIFCGDAKRDPPQVQATDKRVRVQENFDPIVSGDPASDSGVQVSEISSRSDTVRTEYYCILLYYIAGTYVLLYPGLYNIKLS